MSNSDSSFKKILTDLLEEHFLNQTDLSNFTGIPITTINGWLNQERCPDYNSIQKLSIFFDVESDYLLGLIDKNGNDLIKKGNQQLKDYVDFQTSLMAQNYDYEFLKTSFKNLKAAEPRQRRPKTEFEENRLSGRNNGFSKMPISNFFSVPKRVSDNDAVDTNDVDTDNSNDDDKEK